MSNLTKQQSKLTHRKIVKEVIQMSLSKKIILGLCAAGAVGAGYSIANSLCSRPVKATIDIKITKKHAKADSESTKNNAATTDNKQQAKEKTKTDTPQAKAKTKAPKKPAQKSPADDSKIAMQTRRQRHQALLAKKQAKKRKQALEHTARKQSQSQLFLTGKRTNKSYDASTIKRANQLFKQHHDWSFSKCLILAQKG